MKQRLDKVSGDTIIRIEPDAAFVYTVDRSMLGYLKKIKAQPFVTHESGEVVEWRVERGNIAIVDVPTGKQAAQSEEE